MTRRVYKPAFTLEETTRIICDGRGSHFDPAVVAQLRALGHEVETIAAWWESEAPAAIEEAYRKQALDAAVGEIVSIEHDFAARRTPLTFDGLPGIVLVGRGIGIDAEVLGLLQKEDGTALDQDIAGLVEERQNARKNKDFARADAIRDELASKGITLKDTPQGVQIIRG